MQTPTFYRHMHQVNRENCLAIARYCKKYYIHPYCMFVFVIILLSVTKEICPNVHMASIYAFLHSRCV